MEVSGSKVYTVFKVMYTMMRNEFAAMYHHNAALGSLGDFVIFAEIPLKVELYRVWHDKHYAIVVSEQVNETLVTRKAWVLGSSPQELCVFRREVVSTPHGCTDCDSLEIIKVEHDPRERDYVDKTIADIFSGVVEELSAHR
jgi:hypothetical protein